MNSTLFFIFSFFLTNSRQVVGCYWDTTSFLSLRNETSISMLFAYQVANCANLLFKLGLAAKKCSFPMYRPERVYCHVEKSWAKMLSTPR